MFTHYRYLMEARGASPRPAGDFKKGRGTKKVLLDMGIATRSSRLLYPELNKDEL